MKMSLSTSKLSYPEPMREFFPAFKTTKPGQPFCGPAQLSAVSGYESLIKSESDSRLGWARGGGEPGSTPSSGAAGMGGLGLDQFLLTLTPQRLSLCDTRNAQTELGLTYCSRRSTQMSNLRPQNNQVS